MIVLLGAAAEAAGPVVAPTTQPAVPRVTPVVRERKHPLKTARTLYTDQQIAFARDNVKRYPSARKLADDILTTADEWAAWTDDDLRQLITSADVPRAFAVGTAGCPKCGHRINEHGGDYAWIIDPKNAPFKVKCPVDGTVYPSNDYGAFYKSGFTEKKGFDTEFLDDGWGWTDPKSGEKYWFVAYYNHWMWHGKMVPGVLALGRAYLLTGDARYAHKAAAMLQRIAEVYPAMDYETQSRYGQMMRARGTHYPGKVVNAIWETGLITNLADAYDAVWDSIDHDEALQQSTGKTGEQIRSFIEANLLEDGIDAYFSGKMRGNFGMHQSALVHLGLVRQFGEQDKWFDDLMNASSSEPSTLGLKFALCNLIYRDGVPSESSPGYNFLWVSKIASYGDLLARTGKDRDAFRIPETKRLFDAVLDQTVLGRYTPTIGDFGSAWGDLAGKDATTFQTAYRHYHADRYAQFLEEIGATGDASFKTFESLLAPPIERPTTQPTTDIIVPGTIMTASPRSRLLDGYGQAILNNRADTVACSVYYGLKHGHGHFDRLNFELFANGRPMMPDLGYPDAMNEFVPGIFTWSKNTVSHNTVVVDAHRQPGNAHGTVHLFADSPTVHVIDVDGDGTYPQCSQYRRAMIQVDVDDHQSYFVDVFTVAGGKQHDYSLHGPAGEFQMIGGQWSDAEPGTLAGKDVALGQIYDDAKLSAPGYKGGFSSYAGSGFQHLFNVRRQLQPGWIAEFRHEKDPDARLRIRVLNQPGQEVMLCDARVSPVKYPQVLKYLIARRRAEGDEKLANEFVSVLEPYHGVAPFIKDVKLVANKSPNGAAVIVERDGATDFIIYNPTGVPRPRIEPQDIDTSAPVAVLTLDRQQRPTRAFAAGPGSVMFGDHVWTTKGAKARILSVDPARSSATFEAKTGNSFAPGDVVHVIGDDRSSWNRLEEANQSPGLDKTWFNVRLRDGLCLGIARLDGVNEGRLTTRTALPLAATYHHCRLYDPKTRFDLAIVGEVADGKISLGWPLDQGHPFKAGHDAWLLDAASGDRVETVPQVYWTRDTERPAK
jgi:hypothetical protein